VRYQSRTNNAPFEPLFTALNDDEDGEVDKLEAAFQIDLLDR